MRLLVIKLSSLGDLFHALPAVSLVQEAWSAEVDWVTNQGYVELVSRFAPVRRVIGFPRANFMSHAADFLHALRHDHYDFVFDMQGLMKSALTARAARANKIIGPSFHREGASLLYSAVTGPRNKDRHAVEENLDLLDYLGIDRGDIRFPVHFDMPTDLPTDQPKIALLPCSRWNTKNWPPGYFAEVARAISDQAHVYIFGGPEDREICAQIAQSGGPRVINLCAHTSLMQLGGWLAAMDLVITVDSGPMHMAAAAGTPILAIFGATEHRRTGPYGSQHTILTRDDLPCRPCLSRTCQLPEQDMRCLVGITPDRVIRVAGELLDKKRPVA